MNNFIQRTLLFVIGLPLILFIIIYFDRYQHFGWFSLVLLASLAGSVESLHLFLPEPQKRDKYLIPLLGFLIPSAAVADHLFVFRVDLLLLSVLFSGVLILLSELISWESSSAANFPHRSAVLFASVFYPALFMAYMIRFAEFSSPLQLMLLFLLLNFANDTCAYLAGRFFGSRSRKIFAVSPKKTVVGFVGGFLGTVLLGGLYVYFIPPVSAPASLYVIFFILIAAAADVGDLFESALKRGAGIKDSGRIVPGRGGMLDSIDSLLFSAPFFYYIGVVIFT